MYFFAACVPYDKKDLFKDISKNVGLKVRFDYRLKRFEAYGKKPRKKKLLKLISFCNENGIEWHDWSAAADNYSRNVYRKDWGK